MQHGFRVFVLSLLLPLVAAACGSDPSAPRPTVAGTSQSLLKTAWTLVALGPEAQPKAVIAGTEITAFFGEEADRVTGSAGCNSYGGTYATQDGKLTVGALVSTKKACLQPEGVMAQETEYLNTLGAAESYRIDGAVLEIRAKEGRILRFRERK